MEGIKEVKALIDEPLSIAGYEIADIKLFRDKGGLVLSIVVDRNEPISLDDIVKVSDLINPILDANDPIDGPYTLDFSSLGAEKPIDPYRIHEYIGKYINIHLSHPYEGKNSIEGTLLDADAHSLTLEIKEKAKKLKIRLERQYVDKARLAIEF